MDGKLAQLVTQHLNHPKIIETLNQYADYQIGKLREELELTRNDRRIHELQGAIEALKYIYKIREHSLAIVERDRHA